MRDSVDGDRGSDGVRSGDGVITLVPYAYNDGVWSLPDSVVVDVYDQMLVEGTMRSTFPVGIETPQEFLGVMQARTRNLPVFAWYDSTFAICAWINMIHEDHAFGHFWASKDVWGPRVVEVSEKILDYWWSFRNVAGGPLFKVLLGKTPRKNRRAVKFLSRIGFTVAGEIPVIEGGGVVMSYKINPEIEHGRR